MLRMSCKFLKRNSIPNGYPKYYISSTPYFSSISSEVNESDKKHKESQRMVEFRKKLRETTAIDNLGDQPSMHPAQKNDPLPPFPNNTNPVTGEVGGPKGPEPTRYGDWERKGRVSDF